MRLINRLFVLLKIHIRKLSTDRLLARDELTSSGSFKYLFQTYIKLLKADNQNIKQICGFEVETRLAKRDQEPMSKVIVWDMNLKELSKIKVFEVE